MTFYCYYYFIIPQKYKSINKILFSMLSFDVAAYSSSNNSLPIKRTFMRALFNFRQHLPLDFVQCIDNALFATWKHQALWNKKILFTILQATLREKN